VIAGLLTSFYVVSAVGGGTGAVLLSVAANRGALALRPWFAAAVPAAVGYFVVNVARLFADNDDKLTDVARGITLYSIAVLFNLLPYAAWRHSHLTPVVLEEFVAEVGRQLSDTGEIPIHPPTDPGGDGAT
jgi:hypothetical protein